MKAALAVQVRATLLLLLAAGLAVSCSPTEPKPVKTNLPDWPRPDYQAGDERALIYFVVYGQFTNDTHISASHYSTAGLPKGITMRKVMRHEDHPLPFTDGSFGKAIQDAGLYKQIQQAPECMVIQGEIPDSSNLNYLRDIVGVITFFTDHGGFAVCDPQQVELFSANRWRTDIFEGGTNELPLHVKILFSSEAEGQWFHTRGLRKFARPDISIVGVPNGSWPPAIELCKRLLGAEIRGAQIAEGQPIHMAGIPAGLTCHHTGSEDDPDFNNVHIELRWPKKND